MSGWVVKEITVVFLSWDLSLLLRCHRHSFLNISNIQHPHTGEMLAECLSQSLEQWGITEKQVLMIVTDNGANMVKAIRLMQEKSAMQDEGAHEDEDNERTGEVENRGDQDTDEPDIDVDQSDFTEDGETEENMEDENQFHLSVEIPFRRMPCMAHTLQLIIKLAYAHYNTVLTKTRHLVAKIRKSSIAVEKLINKCGKSVISDCTTRWNSTYQMIKRLLVIRNDINNVLNEMGKYFSFTIHIMYDVLNYQLLSLNICNLFCS